MKKLLLIGLVCTAVALSACQQAANDTTANSGNPATTNTASTSTTTNNATAKTENAPAADPNALKFPFADFPAVSTTAKAGELVLCPSHFEIKALMDKGGEKAPVVWAAQTMVAPGAELSELKFLDGSARKAPNAFLIPIPAGQQARRGDIVLVTNVGGMERAIVVDDKNPAAPTVRLLDTDYNTTMKGPDGKTSRGQSDYTLPPNSFVKISATLEPGSAAAVQDGAKLEHVIVIRIAGEKVLVQKYAGFIAVYDKARCRPVPLVPDVKVGDQVQAKSLGSFSPAKVTKVDARIGRVFVKFDSPAIEKVVAFGDIMK